MQVKKRTLYIVCPILLIALIIFGVMYNRYERKKAEERDKAELVAAFEKAVDREYKSLLFEYNSIVETIKDYSYSYSFRYKYVVKLNKLLEERRYNVGGYEYRAIEEFNRDHPNNKAGDLEILKQLARAKAYASFLGIE